MPPATRSKTRAVKLKEAARLAQDAAELRALRDRCMAWCPEDSEMMTARELYHARMWHLRSALIKRHRCKQGIRHPKQHTEVEIAQDLERKQRAKFDLVMAAASRIEVPEVKQELGEPLDTGRNLDVWIQQRLEDSVPSIGLSDGRVMIAMSVREEPHPEPDSPFVCDSTFYLQFQVHTSLPTENPVSPVFVATQWTGLCGPHAVDPDTPLWLDLYQSAPAPNVWIDWKEALDLLMVSDGYVRGEALDLWGKELKRAYSAVFPKAPCTCTVCKGAKKQSANMRQVHARDDQLRRSGQTVVDWIKEEYSK
ncbi:hypothetical protein DFP72DRAFT_1072571 [Ephemerocybe angulata]|uniref:Uncharacterized protein n=1 Tax=Ephemerocybe angulata TaxID=980116 RepID=A0A8H6HNF7_9AGAR|nr:hypothetical protein DFP72DRAFT_1072571 [Tulosesus angulatus]